MANPQAITLHALAERTSDGTGEPADLLAHEATGLLRQFVKLELRAALVASGQLTAVVETSPDGASWRTLWTGPVTTSVTEIVKAAPELSRYLRVRWTVAPDTAVTWELVGEAHVVYCLPADITRYAVPERALQGIPDKDRADACLEATSQADGFVGSAHVLPLRKWSTTLRSHCARIAAATLFAMRGADPNGPDATVLVWGTPNGIPMSWLKRLADGRISDPEIIDSTPETFEGGSVVVSKPSRGWR